MTQQKIEEPGTLQPENGSPNISVTYSFTETSASPPSRPGFPPAPPKISWRGRISAADGRHLAPGRYRLQLSTGEWIHVLNLGADWHRVEPF